MNNVFEVQATFEGTGDQEIEFHELMTSLVLCNLGSTRITFATRSIEFSIAPYMVFDEVLDPFHKIKISGEGSYMGYVRRRRNDTRLERRTTPVHGFRIIIDDRGFYHFEGDEKVVNRAAGINLDTVDISRYRPDLDTLSRVYNSAASQSAPESAAIYLKLKNSIVKQFNK